MTANYWQDYTYFIDTTEKLTQLSPAGLLDQYQELVLSLEEAEKEYLFLSQIEIEDDFLIREKIDIVLIEKSLLENALYPGFKQQITALDERIKYFLIIDEQSKQPWWKAPKIDFEKLK